MILKNYNVGNYECIAFFVRKFDLKKLVLDKNWLYILSAWMRFLSDAINQIVYFSNFIKLTNFETYLHHDPFYGVRLVRLKIIHELKWFVQNIIQGMFLKGSSNSLYIL